MGDITKRDSEVLACIKEYMIEHGATPSMSEVGDGLGISTKTVFTHFQKLIDKGYIIRVSEGKTFRYRVKGMEYVEKT